MCDRTQTAWCPGDLVVGAGLTFDQLFPKGSQPKSCTLGTGALSNPFTDPATGQVWYDCAARQNSGTYFLYDQSGAPVAGANGTPAKIFDALGANIPIVDAQTHQAASVTSWNIMTNTMVSGENNWWTTGCAEHPTTGLVTTGFWSNTVSRIPSNASAAVQGLDLGRLTRISNGLGGAYNGFQTGGAESVVFDRTGNFYVGTVDGTNNILKFDPNGNFLQSIVVPTFGKASEQFRGTDWLELAVDQVTMYYTSESNTVTVFRLDGQPLTQSMVNVLDPVTGRVTGQTVNVFQAGVQPITDYAADPTHDHFGKIVLNGHDGLPMGNTAFALRLLPPGDGSGGLLVATEIGVRRFDLHGNLVRDYGVGGTTDLMFFAMDITPDGKYFWTASLPLANEHGFLMNDPVTAPSHMMKFHIATGDMVVKPMVPAGGSVYGLCVIKEYTAGATQPTCTPTSTDPLCTSVVDCARNPSSPSCTIAEQPKIDPIPDRVDNLGATIDIPIHATDSSRTAVTITSSFIPLGVHLTQTGTSGDLIGTIAYAGGDRPNGVIVTVTATNGLGLSASTQFKWTINYVNGPPVLVSQSAAAVTAPHGVPLTGAQTVTLVTSDPDSCDWPNATLAGAIQGLTVTPNFAIGIACIPQYSFTVSGTPLNPAGVYPATIPVTVNVVDSVGRHTLPIPITYTLTNGPPTITPPANQTLHAGVTVASTVKATTADPNFDVVTVTGIGLPPGITVNPDGTFAGASTVPGTYTVTLTAADGYGGTATGSFTWTITNRPPVITAPPNQTRHIGAPVSGVVATATDPDNDPFTFTVDPTTLPPGLTATTSGGSIQFAGTPSLLGAFTTKLTASDGFTGGTTPATFTWTITNVPPTLTNPGSQFSQPNAPVSLPMQAFDADHDVLTFAAAGLPPGVSIDTATGLISGTVPPVIAATTYSVTVTVTDSYSTPVGVAFTWLVSQNRPPDCRNAFANPGLLWPPNHKFVTIAIGGVTDPDPGDRPMVRVTSIQQDEPTLVVGSGETPIDGIIGVSTAQVRAERSGLYDGRVYFIGFSADDGKGGTCLGTVTVGVPHDQGKQKVPIDSGLRFDSTVPGVPRVR